MAARPRFPGWRDEHSGQAMIEMALLLPFVFFLLLMIVEFGFLLWMNLNVTAAAREAARYASVGAEMGDSDCDTEPNTVKGRAYVVAIGRIECDEIDVRYDERTAPSGSIGGGDGVVVEINHIYAPLTGFLGMIGSPGSLTIHACSDARIELPPASASADSGCP